MLQAMTGKLKYYILTYDGAILNTTFLLMAEIFSMLCFCP